MSNKRPTIKTVRQGQTVYYVYADFGDDFDISCVGVRRLFMYGKNEPLPPYGCEIRKMPIDRFKFIMSRPFVERGRFFYSRKKAIKCANDENLTRGIIRPVVVL